MVNESSSQRTVEIVYESFDMLSGKKDMETSKDECDRSDLGPSEKLSGSVDCGQNGNMKRSSDADTQQTSSSNSECSTTESKQHHVTFGDDKRDGNLDLGNDRWENARLSEEVQELKDQLADMECEVEHANALAQQAEVFKLELINHCNTLEEKIVMCAKDKRMIMQLKAENADIVRKQRGINEELIKQISDITRIMVNMESGYKKQLLRRDKTIEQLQEQVRRSETGGLSPFELRPTPAENEKVDRRRNFARGKSASVRALGNVVGALWEKSDVFDDLNSSEPLSPGQIRDLKLKAARVPELEKQLHEKENALGVFQLASSLVTQLELPDNEIKESDFLVSKEQEETFFRELGDLSRLEIEMGSDLEKLKAKMDSMDSNRSLWSNSSLGSDQGEIMKRISRRSSLCSNNGDILGAATNGEICLSDAVEAKQHL